VVVVAAPPAAAGLALALAAAEATGFALALAAAPVVVVVVLVEAAAPPDVDAENDPFHWLVVSACVKKPRTWSGVQSVRETRTVGAPTTAPISAEEGIAALRPWQQERWQPREPMPRR